MFTLHNKFELNAYSSDHCDTSVYAVCHDSVVNNIDSLRHNIEVNYYREGLTVKSVNHIESSKATAIVQNVVYKTKGPVRVSCLRHRQLCRISYWP